MTHLAVTPTLVIVGLNRSGTTAVCQSFLNHPHVEVFKDPGKFIYESTGKPDFSHFFTSRLFEATTTRVIKQSIGPYTTELCTIPIYPMMERRPDFIRRLHHLFLIRPPARVWQSWQKMSTWLRETDDVAVREHCERLRIDKGIEVGWGAEELFDLSYRYFYQTYKYVQSISPETAYVMDIEDLDEPRRTENIMRQLCQKIGLDYHADMVRWRLLFGEECPRLVDGIRRPLGHPERQYLHRTILASTGLGRMRSKASISGGVDAVAYLRPSTIGALKLLYKTMRNRRLVA